MGLIGRVLDFVRTQRNGAEVSEVKSNTGGGVNITSPHFGPTGDDSQPLPGDYVAHSAAPGQGRYNSVGYSDPVNAGVAGPGEKRIYSRDSSGAVVAEAWLKADGTVEIKNTQSSIVIGADGSVSIDSAAECTINAVGKCTIEAPQVVVDSPDVTLGGPFAVSPANGILTGLTLDPIIGKPMGVVSNPSTIAKSL